MMAEATRTERCSGCGGLGKAAGTGFTCPVCGGTGAGAGWRRVPVVPTAKRCGRNGRVGWRRAGAEGAGRRVRIGSGMERCRSNARGAGSAAVGRRAVVAIGEKAVDLARVRSASVAGPRRCPAYPFRGRYGGSGRRQ